MPYTEIYERVLDELANGEMDDLEQRVFHLLRRAYPAALTRYDLLEYVFGYRPASGENINNNTDDRKIRTAIAGLFGKGVPVVSTSGGAGYRIDIDLESWAEVVGELEGRRRTIAERLDSANRIVAKIRAVGVKSIPSDVPHAQYRAEDQFVQERLI